MGSDNANKNYQAQVQYQQMSQAASQQNKANIALSQWTEDQAEKDEAASESSTDESTSSARRSADDDLLRSEVR